MRLSADQPEPRPASEAPPPERTTAERFQRVALGLYRYVVVRLHGDEQAADDLMQELWLVASREEHHLVANFEAWLRGVARNLVSQHWRRRGRRARTLADPALAAEIAAMLDREDLPEDWLERSEVHGQVILALTQLSAADQDLIIRRHTAGEPLDRLAERLGCSVRAVEGRLYRARIALREALSRIDP